MGLFNAMGDVVSSVVEAVAGEDSILAGIADAVGLDSVFDAFGLDELISGSLGGFVNNFFDGLGFPDVVGDAFGVVTDALAGNPVGMADNLVDALDDVADAITGTDVPLDKLDGETFIDFIS